MKHTSPSRDSAFVSLTTQPLDRRSAVKRMASLALLSLGLEVPSLGLARTSSPTPTPTNSMTPEAALQRLLDGNKRYTSGKTRGRNFSIDRATLTRGQNPYACILSCADSRVSPELCFDESRGDLFVNRLAGNYVSLDMLASLEYGATVLRAPLIMVLGHTNCGAIKAAMQAEQGNVSFPGHIQLIATDLRVAVREGLKDETDPVEAASRENVKINVTKLRESTPLLRKLVVEQKLMVVGGLYHLDTGKIELIP